MPRADKGKKGDAEERRKVTIYLPVAQARALKVHAAQHDKDMSLVVAELSVATNTRMWLGTIPSDETC